MTQLVRVNYTYSHFYYHLICANVANFDKICTLVSEIQVIKTDIKQRFSIRESQIHNYVILC